MRTGSRYSGGFAYLLLLIAVAVIGLAASATVSIGQAMGRRDAEQHLLAIGGEFDRALRSYAGVPATALSAPAGLGPRKLDDLLKDPRTPGLRRHLRQIYTDPLTGEAAWGIVTDSQGFIVGVHSLADGSPIKTDGFPLHQASFAGASSYRQWVFGLPAASR